MLPGLGFSIQALRFLALDPMTRTRCVNRKPQARVLHIPPADSQDRQDVPDREGAKNPCPVMLIGLDMQLDYTEACIDSADSPQRLC